MNFIIDFVCFSEVKTDTVSNPKVKLNCENFLKKLISNDIGRYGCQDLPKKSEVE